MVVVVVVVEVVVLMEVVVLVEVVGIGIVDNPIRAYWTHSLLFVRHCYDLFCV